MVNHLLETSHPPLFSSALSLCASAADPAFHSSPFLYLLTSLPPYLLFSVHTSKFRIPQPLYLPARRGGPLLRKHPGDWRVFFPFRNSSLATSILVGDCDE